MAQLDIDALRNGTAAERAALLRTILATSDAASLTAQLSDAIAAGLLDPAVFDTWLNLSHDPAAIVAALRQTQSLTQRRLAIRQFGKATRSESHFSALWAAAGGAPGIAAVMSRFSVDEVKRLCSEIRKSASAPQARGERQRRMTELLRLLCGNQDEDLADGVGNPDPRPLKAYYERISLACGADSIFPGGRFDRAVWSDKERGVLLRVHRATFEARFVDALSSGRDLELELSSWICLIDGDLKFAEDVLTRLLDSAGTIHAAVDAKIIEQKLLLPLARRLVRRGTDHGARERIFALVVSAVRKYPVIAGGLDFSQGGLVHRAIQIWRRGGPEERIQAEKHLASLLALMPSNATSSLDGIASASLSVPPALRCELFRLLVRHAGPFGMDILSPSDEDIEDLAKRKERLPMWLFSQALGAARGSPGAVFSLFQRYAAVHPTGDFVTTAQQHSPPSILNHPAGPDKSGGDTELLGTMLARSAGASRGTGYGSTERVQNELKARKDKAATCREWQGRAFWTTSAMFMCIAAGSYEMYAETLLWARRFNKDVHTVKQIYAREAMETVEGLELLAGFRRSGPVTGDRVRSVEEKVAAGNLIVHQLLETAAMALREPSFHANDWNSVTGLPARVVNERLKGVDDLQDRLALSDDDIFVSVWQPTLDMLLAVETFFLRAEHVKLKRSGLVSPADDLDLPKGMRSHAWKFFNHLAWDRDELWRKYRPGDNPSVVTLQSPFPRGLPIQFLLPTSRSTKQREYRLPYVQSRAKVVVFSKPDEVLVAHPEAEGVREAIGPFIDRYQSALDVYVNGFDADSDRDSRIQLAWEHATGPLGAPRMTRVESLRFWADIFKSARIDPPDFRAELPKRADPALPVEADGDAPVEWDPDPDYCVEAVKSRQLPHTILDCMLEVPDMSFMPGSWPVTVSTKAVVPKLFWDVDRFPKPVSQQTREALAIAAILYINSSHGSDASLLKQPYLVGGRVRFPAVYLAEEFLEQQEKTLGSSGPGSALGVLRWVVDAVPVPQLALSLLEKMKSSTNAKPELVGLTVDVVGLVARGDCPSLATPFIRGVVLEMQSDSAWHRTFLNSGYLKTLPAADAGSLLDTISGSIVWKLREQAARRKNTAEQKEAADATPRPPAVKISTVKMLAQLLRDADFLDPAASVDILGELLANSRHIDIRIAVFDSVLSTLRRETSPAKLKSHILAELEANVVPIAASLQDLRPTVEADWGAAEAGGELPEVSEGTGLSDIQAMLFRLTPDSVSGEDIKKRLGRLLVQVVEQSAANNSRWMSLFVKKNGLVLPHGKQLPAYPVTGKLLIEMLSHWIEYMPRRLFEMVRHAVLINLTPPSDIAAITKTVKDSPALCESNAGRHWLAQYDNPGILALRLLGGFEAARQLHRGPIHSQVENGVTTQMLREFVLDLADVLIANGDTQNLTELVEQTCAYKSHADSRPSWKAHSVPVIREIVRRLKLLRTEAWQRDPKRKPAVLPDPFQLEMAMLPHPLPSAYAAAEPDTASLREAVEYTDQLSGLIDQLASRKTPYHASWAELKQQTTEIAAAECAGFAVELGSRVRTSGLLPSLGDYLRVELARELLRRADEPKEEVSRAVKAMLRAWNDSPVEGFRLEVRQTVESSRAAWGMREWLALEAEGE
ncbi:hypothetical protein CONLIGDRAFT_452084 [Coniochaeta ligniaria NRRL 30616]|uniref:Uncharacterized protein n=1 Tax=Coniochaeta ligniaria NRRL 30616 TaxID=1408157 RepID=A0A1J7IK25_9PEZI|nr:hypothetical protein CONLIGDRAFT_452084 [Coniochaeta ligniaria NRRL 30616]